MSVKLKSTLPDGHGHTADRILRHLAAMRPAPHEGTA